MCKNVKILKKNILLINHFGENVFFINTFNEFFTIILKLIISKYFYIFSVLISYTVITDV